VFGGAEAQTLRDGVYLTVGDINGDGHADIIAGAGPAGGPRVLILNGDDLLTKSPDQAGVLANFFAGNIDGRGGIRLAVKNLDGDTNADLVAGEAGKCAEWLKKRYVNTPENVDQNRGGARALGNRPEYDAFLVWASEADRTEAELQAALNYVCLRIVQTARPVKAMPQLEKSKLTFAAVLGLLEEMLTIPSRGTYQQFIVAALLTGRVQQSETKQRVETKAVNATDESSRAAADVQIKSGTRVEEAYEVTGNDWATKLGEAEKKIRRHDLSRIHIVARVADVQDMIDQLSRQAFDISALDLTAFVSVLVSELRREYRAAALRRLHELLERHQADIELVNGYVDLLAKHSLVT
jgi:hypothetical protein